MTSDLETVDVETIDLEKIEMDQDRILTYSRINGIVRR